MRIIPAWARTAGRLRAEGAEVRAVCDRCNASTVVNLDGVIAKHGELFSFWDRRPRCPANCGSSILFVAARPGAGIWPTNMRTDGDSEVKRLHELWAADRAAVRRAEDVWRFLRKRRRRRAKVRAEAMRLIAVSDTPAEDAVDGMALARGDERDFWAEVRLDVLRRQAGTRVNLDSDL